MHSTEDDTSLSPADKKKQMDQLQREINDLYKKAVNEIHKQKSKTQRGNLNTDIEQLCT